MPGQLSNSLIPTSPSFSNLTEGRKEKPMKVSAKCILSMLQVDARCAHGQRLRDDTSGSTSPRLDVDGNELIGLQAELIDVKSLLTRGEWYG